MLKRIIFGLILAGLLGGAFAVIHLSMPGWYARWWYPLDNAADIERYAGFYRLEPELVAAVIYQESSFKEHSTSPSGAVGLMQLMPGTAAWIAGKTGESVPTTEDLKKPETNIRYGCWYLRYLLDHYNGSEVMALAAYNGGAENADQWLAAAKASGRQFNSVLDIPYQETRDYVAGVDKAKEIYHKAYGEELDHQ